MSASDLAAKIAGKASAAPASTCPVKALSDEEWETVFNSAVENLEEAGEIYVHDASVGSFRDNTVRVRFITDDASTALLARNILVNVFS
jgi:ATP-dependent phosphoenolpyruvate carboxykinase